MLHWQPVKEEAKLNGICTGTQETCANCSSKTRQLCIINTRAGRRLLIEADVHDKELV